MKRLFAAVISSAALFALPAQAGDWRVGVGINVVTGIDDVADFYEANYNNSHTYTAVEIELLIPVGLSVQATHTWDSGVRLDLGLGPVFWLIDNGDGDFDTGLEHWEVPVSATVGYTFIPSGEVSPYVRAGFAHHFASGDYVEGSKPGLFAAAGIEFMRSSVANISLEVAIDKSKVEFEKYTRVGLTTRRSLVELETYETLISLMVKF